MTDLTSERLTSCPLCGSDRLRAWRTVLDAGRAEMAPPLHYLRCGACDVMFLRDRLVESSVDRLYTDDYEPYDPNRVGRVTARATPSLAGRLLSAVPNPAESAADALYGEPRGAGRLLDFGCGSPSFLVDARARGWTPTGVDFPESVLGNVRDAGFPALSVVDAMVSLAPASFDVVRMSHVLEHLYEPRRVIGWLRGLLAPGGLLHVSVPNPLGVSSLVFRRHWKSLEPRHVILYPPDRLVSLLHEAGFDRITIAHETLSKDAVRSAGLLLAAHSRQTIDQALGRGNGRLGAALLRPAAWLAAAAGRADRFHAFAEV